MLILSINVLFRVKFNFYILEETHKRITLLLEKISEENKITLHKIFGQEKLEELSEKEANEILLRASPFETQSTGLNKSIDSVRKYGMLQFIKLCLKLKIAILIFFNVTELWYILLRQKREVSR